MNRSGNTAQLRRIALIALQLGVTVAAIVLVLRGLDVSETVRSLRKADYWLLIPAVAFLLMDLQLRAIRWRLLLLPQKNLSHGNLFGATNVGYLVNDVLPLRLGEVARTFLIDELEKTGKIRAGASIAVERGIDVVVMILLLVALLPFINEPAWARGPALLFGAFVVAGFVAAIFLSGLNESADAFWKARVRRIPRFGERIESVLDKLLAALQPLRRVSVFAAVAVLSGVIWFCAIMSFFMVMLAFHLGVGIPAAGLVLGATTLGMVVPSSPGYVGVFHAIAVETLVNAFGIPKESALTYAFAQHALIYFVPATLGAAFLWTHRVEWTALVASLRPGRAAPLAAAPIVVPEKTP